MDDGALKSFAEGIWIDTAPVRILGTRLTATMTVLRLADGGLVLHSPLAMTEERRAAVVALGSITHLYAPNLYHHTWIGEWAAAYPSARLHAPAPLAKKRPDLRIDRVHGAAPEPAFDGFIDEVRVRGLRLKESALYYRPGRTLVVADLLHNVGRPQHVWSKLYTQTMGFYNRVALSRVIRWTAFSDRVTARKSVDELLALPFERMIVGHGSPLTSEAKQALSRAFEWLPSAST